MLSRRHDLYTLDDCDLLEKVVIMTNVIEHNDVTVSIKVQQFRCRYAKYVYNNCIRVLCECHAISVIANQAEYQ